MDTDRHTRTPVHTENQICELIVEVQLPDRLPAVKSTYVDDAWVDDAW